ncbi:TPA: hypothetical protein U0J94_001553 [Streptococcus suis]|uniref:hypothetical protein n=1 Tax=Streptococcus suis TaxID=1307 RepID=UPI000945A35E|nr:hypothetical protein [Streptococcus suis]HEL2343259.1 hypothetical protein [Streptococcus suis]HEL9624129.1 hypothetical protein [Streptococcus suis]HEM3885910.1 hypothetical protein [Streptococcus suis]
MGTLFDQPPRMRDEYSLNYADQIAAKIKDIETNYNLSEYSATEAVRMSIDIRDKDIKDEQLAGFGEILQYIADSLNRGED